MLPRLSASKRPEPPLPLLALCAPLAAEQLALPVFVNVEPDTFATPCPPDLLPIFDAATTGLDLVIEITERMIAPGRRRCSKPSTKSDGDEAGSHWTTSGPTRPA